MHPSVAKPTADAQERRLVQRRRAAAPRGELAVTRPKSFARAGHSDTWGVVLMSAMCLRQQDLDYTLPSAAVIELCRVALARRPAPDTESACAAVCVINIAANFF